MRKLLLALAFGVACTAAYAQQANDCDKLAWPMQKERQMLASSPAGIASGETLSGQEIALTLPLTRDAALAMPPERKPRGDNATSGFVRVSRPGAGRHRITISDDGWIDVIQDGRYLKPSAFTSVHACPGIRKSVQVELSASPLTIQISDAKSDRIGIAITPAP